MSKAAAFRVCILFRVWFMSRLFCFKCGFLRMACEKQEMMAPSPWTPAPEPRPGIHCLIHPGLSLGVMTIWGVNQQKKESVFVSVSVHVCMSDSTFQINNKPSSCWLTSQIAATVMNKLWVTGPNIWPTFQCVP